MPANRLGLTLAGSVAALALLTGAARAEPHPFNAKDMVTLDRVSDPRVSPDGRWVAYDLRTADYDKDKAAHSIWVADLKASDPAPRRLAISDGGVSQTRWASDGSLYFISGRSGSDQVWRTTAEGTVATQVTRLPLDVGSFKLNPNGKQIVVSLAVFPDCPTPQCTRQRIDAKAAEKTTGELYDKLFVRHWDTWADGTRNALWALDLDASGVAAGPAKAMMPGFDGDSPSKPYGGDEDYTFSPDGKELAFTARTAGRTEPWSTNFDIWAGPSDGSGPMQNATEANKAMDMGAIFSPNQQWAAYRAMSRPTFEADRFRIMVRDEKTQVDHELAPNWDRSAQSMQFSPDSKTLYVTAEDLGQTKLFAIDVKTGAVKALTGDGHVSGFDVGPKGIIVAREQLDSPPQLYRLSFKGGALQPITHHNAQALSQIEFGGFEQFAFPGWNGETVHGYLVKPVNFDPSRKYPVAFLIHGGPQGSFGNIFHYRWNAETYAGHGYAVVMIDFHGSTGYGQACTDAISGHWGDRPLEDLQKGWAYALGKYSFLDGGRACALGGSYGGYMANWIAGNWKEPWKCIVDHDGIFDNRMMGYSTEELWFSEWENGRAPVWENPAAYEKFNPANHVADWSVPELVIHGGKDYRIPMEQGLATFTALQRKGVPSQFLYYPDENHWVLKPQNSVLWHTTVFDWLDKWTGPEAAAK
jgi:acylaminoacyl-peptidase